MFFGWLLVSRCRLDSNTIIWKNLLVSLQGDSYNIFSLFSGLKNENVGHQIDFWLFAPIWLILAIHALLSHMHTLNLALKITLYMSLTKQRKNLVYIGCNLLLGWFCPPPPLMPTLLSKRPSKAGLKLGWI